MAKKVKVIKRPQGWSSNFTLVGAVKVNDNTFKLDEVAEGSGWQYNSMNIGIDCGHCGVVYANMMGGFGHGRDNIIKAHGKDEDGRDNFENKIDVAWEDRNDESITENLGDLCFITVGIEKTSKGSTFYKKFLSEYDAIAYMAEHLEDGMVVNIKGRLKYTMYNGNVQVQKNITSVALSKAESADDYRATFTQSILLDSASVNLKEADKEKKCLYVHAMVLDFLKEYNGHPLVNEKGEEKGAMFPFKKDFEYPVDLTNSTTVKALVDKVLKVKRGVTMITFSGEIVEGGAVVTATWDDVPQDIKDLVTIGLYTKEEALASCSQNAPRETRMLLLRPDIRMVENKEGEKKPVLQKFDEKFTEDELILDYLFDDGTDDVEQSEDAEVGASTDGDDMSWLNDLE